MVVSHQKVLTTDVDHNGIRFRQTRTGRGVVPVQVSDGGRQFRFACRRAVLVSRHVSVGCEFGWRKIQWPWRDIHGSL
jgi:hypothetical protein